MFLGDIVYVMVRLNPSDKDGLAELVRARFGEQYPKTYCDHLTLAYGKDQIEHLDLDSIIGRKVVLHGSAICRDERCVALTVEPSCVKDICCNNEFPHITLATDGMTPPVYSNELIRNVVNGAGGISEVADVDVSGIVDVFRKPIPIRKTIESIAEAMSKCYRKRERLDKAISRQN